MRLFLIFNNVLMWSQISFNHQVYLQMQMKTRVQMFEKQNRMECRYLFACNRGHV